jgi:hypothetical protein
VNTTCKSHNFFTPTCLKSIIFFIDFEHYCEHKYSALNWKCQSSNDVLNLNTGNSNYLAILICNCVVAKLFSNFPTSSLLLLLNPYISARAAHAVKSNPMLIPLDGLLFALNQRCYIDPFNLLLSSASAHAIWWLRPWINHFVVRPIHQFDFHPSILSECSEKKHVSNQKISLVCDETMSSIGPFLGPKTWRLPTLALNLDMIPADTTVFYSKYIGILIPLTDCFDQPLHD